MPEIGRQVVHDHADAAGGGTLPAGSITQHTLASHSSREHTNLADAPAGAHHAQAHAIGGADHTGNFGVTTFDDQAADPDATGELQRNDADLLWYTGAGVAPVSLNRHWDRVHWFADLPRAAYFTTSTSGSAAINDTTGHLDLTTGATINSILQLKLDADNNASGHDLANAEAVLVFYLYGGNSVADLAQRCDVNDTNDPQTVPSDHNFGWQFDTADSPNHQCISGDGTTGSASVSGTAVTAGNENVRVHYRPTVDVRLYRNGTLLVTKTTNLPGGTMRAYWNFCMENLAAADKNTNLGLAGSYGSRDLGF